MEKTAGTYYDKILEQLIDQGPLVMALAIVLWACYIMLKKANDRNDALADKMIDVIQSNANAMSKLSEKIDELR